MGCMQRGKPVEAHGTRHTARGTKRHAAGWHPIELPEKWHTEAGNSSSSSSSSSSSRAAGASPSMQAWRCSVQRGTQVASPPQVCVWGGGFKTLQPPYCAGCRRGEDDEARGAASSQEDHSHERSTVFGLAEISHGHPELPNRALGGGGMWYG